MIRYIIVDDDQKTLERVKAKIDAISVDYNLEHIASYNSSKKAYEQINAQDYDLLIVDFEMPVFNGIELAKKIAANKKIIFLTSTTDNEKTVINNLNISGYLSKPFEVNQFEQILKNKVIDKIDKSNSSRVNIPVGKNRDVQFLPEQVYYVSTFRNINDEKPQKNCVHFYGKNDQLLFSDIRITVSNLYKILEPYNFEKISDKTIINLSHLKERDNIHIRLHGCSQPFEVKAKEKTSLISKIRTKIGF